MILHIKMRKEPEVEQVSFYYDYYQIEYKINDIILFAKANIQKFLLSKSLDNKTISGFAYITLTEYDLKGCGN